MAEGRSLRADVFMIIAIIVVQVGGFWMMGKLIEEKTESLRQKASATEASAQQAVDKLVEVQKQLLEIKKMHGSSAPVPAVAPAVAPAPTAPTPSAAAAVPATPSKKPAAPAAAKAPAAKAP